MSDSTVPPSVLPATAEAVLTFLDSVGRRSEAELYLRLFRELPPESFAVIAVESVPISAQGASIAEQLRFLADLRLFAPIVIGLFDPARSRALADRFTRRLGSVKLEANIYPMSARGVAELVRTDLRSGIIPILVFDEDAEQAIDRYHAVGNLAAALASRKIVVVRQHGALGANMDRDTELAPQYPLLMGSNGISVVNLLAELELLQQSTLLNIEDLALLSSIQAVFERVQIQSLVFNVTGPFDLLKELFTVKGAGTVVRRGTSITRAQSYAELDQARLRKLIESSFGRKLRPDLFSAPYWQLTSHLNTTVPPSLNPVQLLQSSVNSSLTRWRRAKEWVAIFGKRWSAINPRSSGEHAPRIPFAVGMPGSATAWYGGEFGQSTGAVSSPTKSPTWSS